MKNLIIFLIKYFLFWLLFFLVAKILFLVFNFSQTSSLSAAEILNIFIYGIKMDISTVCYFMILPGLIATLVIFWSDRFANLLIRGYTVALLVVATFLLLLDFKLYPHWGSRIGVQLFNYIYDPVSVSASVSMSDALPALLVVAAIVGCFILLYRKLFPRGAISCRDMKWYHIPVALFLLIVLIIPMRGGLNTSPLNMSSIAFSPKLFVNQAAVNYIWNFGHSIEKKKVYTNPCKYMEPAEAQRIFEKYQKMGLVADSTELIQRPSDGKQPDVILIILESFSDKVIASLGGRKDIAPCLDSLCNQSVVFTSFYASGNRSDRGVSAILASYPSLLYSSVMQFSEKWENLTFIPQYFNHHQYSTSFYYGGDINFYNLKSFAIKGEYGKIIEKGDFPARLGRMTKWGVPDGYLFERVIADIRDAREPFFKTIYTVSSHPPYDVPFSKIKGKSIENMYLNSVAYTDSCLGAFITNLKKMPLWKNTLVVITADHGALQPGPTEISHPDTYRIPMLWTGGVIRKPMKIDNISGQSDIMPTLVRQLGWKSKPTRFGHDIFSSPHYAFYMLDAGWGYIVPEGKFYFNQDLGKFTLMGKGEDKSVDFSFPKAYLQVLHEDFITR